MVARGASSHSPTSPASSRHGNGASKRKRSTGVPAHHESSPGSGNDDDHGDHDKKRQPGVKRACNECRQQKVHPEHSPAPPPTHTDLAAPRQQPRMVNTRQHSKQTKKNHWLTRHLTYNSSAAMSSKTPSSRAPAASDSSSNARSNPTSSA